MFGFSGDAGHAATPSNCPPGQRCPLSPLPPQVGRPSAGPPAQGGPLGPVYTTDPNALASILAAAAAAGSAMLAPPGDVATADPAEAGLRAGARKYAPGMSPEGHVAKGNLAEGGHVEFMTQMDPGKCYTIIAYGDGLADMDVNLLAPPLYNIVAGQDGMVGPTAVIGATPNPLCPILPIPIPYKIDLHAKKGGGAVAAQVYVKSK
jgi:hypothetical protein